MAVADELVIAVRSEGTKETRDDLEDVESQFSETADKTDKSSENLEGFAGKFKGAMKVAVAALAVGAAGFLAQLPAVGMAVSGLSAILAGLSFQLNKLLTPVSGPLSDAFFKVANAIFEADGAVGKLLGAGTGIGALILILKGAALAGSGLAATILGLGATLLSLPVILGVLIAALIAFVAAYIFNWKGTRDKTDKILAQIADFVREAFDKFIAFVASKLGPFVEKVKAKFGEIKDDIKSWADDLAARAKQWGVNLIQRFIDGIKSKIRAVGQAFGNVTSSVGGALGINVNSGSSGGTAAVSGTSRGRTLQLDGRRLERRTGRYGADSLTRRNI